MDDPIYSVSEFVDAMRIMLADMTVKVRGEVSNFHINQGRLVFFDLKDKASYVSCFMMAFTLDIALEEGMEIVVTASPSLFKKSGKFHLAIKKIELVGVGALQKEYERLRNQLEKEGLFDVSHKRSLPKFPEHLAVLTSLDSAALTDVKRVLANRWPLARVLVYATAVQGKVAIPGILRAIQWVNQEAEALDTVILTRGGGSLEDLQAFNSEDVCRAVFACKVPTVTGVGHERDETLVEYVADVRAATPSNAAELAVPHREDVRYVVDQLTDREIRGLQHTLYAEKERFRDLVNHIEQRIRLPADRIRTVLVNFPHAVARFVDRLKQITIDIQTFERDLSERVARKIDAEKNRVEHTKALLLSLSPLRVLERGYSVTVAENGHIVRNASQLSAGQKVSTTLAKGKFTSVVQ